MTRFAVAIVLAILARVAVADPSPISPPPCVDDKRFDAPGTGSKPGPSAPRASEYVGKTLQQILDVNGEPACKSPGKRGPKWRYWLPRGCAYDKHVVTLWFSPNMTMVERATVVHIVTGEECALRK